MQVYRLSDRSLHNQAALEASVRELEQGGIIAYPTDTLYGLGVDATREDSLKKLFELKKRDQTPMAVMVADRAALEELVEPLTAGAAALVEAFLPGALTIILPPRQIFSPLLLGEQGGIGIRIPDHPFCQELAQRFGKPITATSANPSGYEPARTIERVVAYFDDRVEVLIDGGWLFHTQSSTVVDCTFDPPRIRREGAIPAHAILEVWNEAGDA